MSVRIIGEFSLGFRAVRADTHRVMWKCNATIEDRPSCARRAEPLQVDRWQWHYRRFPSTVGASHMKFAYVDESGDKPQGDVFVMAGVQVDAYKLRKHTTKFDKMISDFLAKHPGAPKELKTKALINGEGGWRQVEAEERKRFVSEICDLAIECGTVFAIALSFRACEKVASEKGFSNTYWMAAAMFVAGLLQKKMQAIRKNKGLTVLIFDDNRREVPNLSDALHEADPWYDPLYQTRKKGQGEWQEISAGARFNQIVNTAFGIKWHHSSFIQVADVEGRGLGRRERVLRWSGK
jgi:hypothetical protein